MNFKKSAIGSIIVILATHDAYAQGAFQNLDFEQGDAMFVGGGAPFTVTTASAVPFWTVAIGGVGQTEMTYNGASTGAPAVSLLGPPPPNPGVNPIDGNYSVLLTGSFPASAMISQTGTIPEGSESLFFKAQPGRGAFDVLIGNESVPFFAVGSGANYTLYGASISAWAGDTEQITFSALQSDNGLNNWVLDDISFSPNAVPEPSPFLLLAIGGTMAGLYNRFRIRA